MSIDRVLVTGDCHGNTAWVTQHVLRAAKKYRCDLVLQVGDWGIWPGAGGVRYLDAVDREAERLGIPVWFCDGNHEAFDLLLALPLDEYGRRPVRPNITHLPRGHRWEWHGQRFLACGGAVSVDQQYRLPGISWWPEEAITQADIDACLVGGEVDVFVTHDIQPEVPAGGRYKLQGIPPEIEMSAHQSRLALQVISDAVKPKLQVHGHWHSSADQQITRASDGKVVRVVSLTCDSGAHGSVNGHCAVLDLTALDDGIANAIKVVD